MLLHIDAFTDECLLELLLELQLTLLHKLSSLRLVKAFELGPHACDVRVVFLFVFLSGLL
jgi:hypothetical protein